MNLADAKVMAAAPEMLTTLKLFVETYVGLVNSGDCGNWDPETDAIVMVARAVVSKAEGTSK
jgi:hypothetical protein